ncbi:hypothetical protein PHYBOEH_010565 [Phytophthora boehmeriae]|uniref:PWWP domain-containing protein n=1 Tax=Phytophthora boehmeriae TaxID=109152 RepID=A0A8T1X0L3_9STRA|nr:hypothetical protein PHYBOEH_010565 [Phytophthora boehmeriae]
MPPKTPFKVRSKIAKASAMSRTVEVTYDGWEKEYDEVVCLDSDRVAPYHTFTWAVKCWVKYLNWPLWPAMITIRTPGTEAGIENLGKENRLWVDFFDHSNFLKRDRCWQKKCQVKNFDDHYDENGFGTSGKEFNQSLELMLKSDATTEMPKFTRGTLPVQYKTVTTESVDQKRTSVGGDLWFENFAKNRERHCRMYVYEMIGNVKMKLEEGVSSDKTAEQEKMVVEKAKQAALSTTGLNPTSASAPRVAEEMNVYHLQSEDTERSLLERIAGKDDSKTDGPWKGRIKETAVELREEPVHSVLSESKDPSFNSDESKSTPAALEDGTLTKLPSDNEETKVPGQSIENIRSASTLPRKAMEHNTPRKPHLPAMQDDDSHADNKEDEDLQEVRRHPYCVMQAGQEDDLTSNANKHPKKTVISVPRKFEEALVKQRDLVVNDFTSMLKLFDDGHSVFLCLPGVVGAIVVMPHFFSPMLAIGSISLDEARDGGWVDPIAESASVSELINLFDFSLVHWGQVSKLIVT